MSRDNFFRIFFYHVIDYNISFEYMWYWWLLRCRLAPLIVNFRIKIIKRIPMNFYFRKNGLDESILTFHSGSFMEKYLENISRGVNFVDTPHFGNLHSFLSILGIKKYGQNFKKRSISVTCPLIYYFLCCLSDQL